jgi:DNA-binding response OmpR family regulator
MTASRILIVEDDVALATALRASFAREGFDCTVAHNGADGLRLTEDGFIDVVLLDVRLPGMNGLDVCEELRKRSPAIPILMITALGHELDVVAGLRTGADDYIIKPFAFTELLARVEAVMRRRPLIHHRSLTARFADILVDLTARVVTKNGRVCPLSLRDFDILCYFLERRGKLVTRRDLAPLVGGDSGSATRLLDTYVWRLRRAIEDSPGAPQMLVTIHARGYVFRPKVEFIENES